MMWYIVVSHIILAAVLFFLINWIGAHATPMGYMQLSIGMKEDTAPVFNYLFKVLAPVVFVVLLAAFFQVVGLHSFNRNIYLIVVYYWLFRLAFVIVVGHASLLNWPLQFVYWVSSIGIAYWVYTLIGKLDTILPSPQSLIEQLWLLIILFIYSIFNKLEISRVQTEKRKNKYIETQFNKLHKRFGGQVEDFFQSDFMRALTFSIMLYENYNRSAAVRTIERLLGKRSKKKHTYGVMQVTSDHVLTDEESVLLGMQKISSDIKKYVSEIEDEEGISLYDAIQVVSNAYNGGDENYFGEIWTIFSRLTELFYKAIPDRLTINDIDYAIKDRTLLGLL